jgi:hypothetical protein
MPTISLGANSSSRSILDLTSHLATSLQAQPEAAAQQLGRSLAASADRLNRAMAARDGVNARLKLATGKVRSADDALDDAVREMDSELLVLVKRDRKHPMYRKVYPRRTLADLIKLPDEEEIAEVRAIVTVLGDPELAALTHHAARLQAAIQGVQTALQERERVHDEERGLVREWDLAGDAARKAFNAAYYKLFEIYPEQKSKIRSLYKPGRPRKPKPKAET